MPHFVVLNVNCFAFAMRRYGKLQCLLRAVYMLLPFLTLVDFVNSKLLKCD